MFDEIVAYSVNPSESVDIMDNGNAIVSINTDGSGTGVIMSGSACNTYQNKTTYGKNTVTMNGNTRYYYNLDTIRSGSPSDAEKLLLWSVQQYAHSSIAGYNYFGTSFTPSGTTLDMTGLSYYTIDYANSFPFSNRNFSLTFYNKEIETGESGTGNTDNNPRSTVSTSSQHYMMHCGLFRNAPANSLTLGSVTLSGNVGKYNGGSGYIISGKRGGDASVTSQFSDTGITLNGAYIYTGDNAIAAGSYAPLLFNSVGKNADLKIKNVSTSGYTSFSGYAASSLIGKVGADDASDSNMNIEFSGVTLDASEVHSVTINGTTYTARADKTTNTRQGGIVISLYQMGTRNEDQHDYGIPLPDGVFTLKKGNQRIGTYTSDENGKITILYDFIPNETYTLIQESAPGTYIALPNPVTFSVGSGDHPEITVGGNPIQWNDWHEPYVSGDQLVAYIDVYNKRFTLKAVKVDKDDNAVTLENAQFALYRSVNSVDGLIPDINPISGYETLTTDENGVIPLITESLPDGTFFLRETQSAAGYKPFLRPIRFTIRENDVVLFDDTSGGAAISTTTVEDGVSVTTVTANNGVKLIKTDGNAYECVLQIPNEKDQQNYYFDIEKIIFVDKNVHDSDMEQKFIFRVERFAEGTTSFDDENIQASFYVTMNCDRELTYTDDDNIQYTADASEYHYELYHNATGTDAPKYEFIESGSQVRRTYNSTDVYTFPAAIWSGRKTVHVSSKGIYRVSEVKDWSTTDYDFWSGSNVYKGYGTPVREGQADGFVIFDVSAVKAAQFQSASTSIGGETVYRPTASFTNSETEFAYLSSQAYADNKIKR